MSTLRHDSIEEYQEWLSSLGKDRLLDFISKHLPEMQSDHAAGKRHGWTFGNADENAVYGDLSGLVKHGESFGLYAHIVQKRRRAAQRRAETMAETRDRFGPGHDQHGHKRDSQREKMYRAERASIQDWPGQRTWETVPEMQSYVDHLLASAWWKRRWPTVRAIRVKDGRGHRNACSEGGSIEMPRWARKDAVLLHEVAHEIVGRTIGYRREAPHGREFCRIYLELVRHKMGADAGRALKAAFQERKVKHTRVRTMTPEQREAAAARLAACRPSGLA